MISLVVPTLDTLRQWLDDLGMNFFECDTCQALHLPHMQNFDGVYDAKIDLVDNTVLFSAMAEVRPSALLPLAADLSAINASSLTVKPFSICRMIICQNWLCASLYPLCKASPTNSSNGLFAKVKSRFLW